MKEKRWFYEFGCPQIRVQEECSEVIKAIAKTDRFELENFHPKTPNITNAQEILNEINDLEMAINMLKPLLETYIKRLEFDIELKKKIKNLVAS